MKKIWTILGCLLLSFCFLLAGCSGLEMPANDAKVYGNGGTVVQKGDYVYFANAYTGYSSLSDNVSNKKGESGLYSLYRVKVSDTNGTLDLDEQGNVKNAEVVVEKVVGFEYSNLYIVGDYLYFSSPNMHKTSANEHKFELISIFRVKLDGSGLKELYTTETYSGDWAIYEINDVNYVVTYEGSEIVRHTINKKAKLEDKVVLADNVTKAVLPQGKNYANDNKIFFTTALSETDKTLGLTGNILKSVDIESKNVKTLSNNGDTIEIMAYNFGNLIYNVKNLTDDKYVWANDFNGNAQRLTYWQVTDAFVASVMNQGLKLIYTYEDNVVIQNFGSYQTSVLIEGKATIINIDEDYVYYTLDNKISRISLVDNTTVEIYENSSMADVYDFDGRYIYLFVPTQNSTTNIKYMHRIDTFALEQEVEVSAQPMGEIDADDLKKAEDK